MSRVNPPEIVIYDAAEGRYKVAAGDPVCVARWSTSNRGHRAGDLCGRPATRNVGDIDLCEHHWRRAVADHHKNWTCLAYDAGEARWRRAEACRIDREREERSRARAAELEARAVVYYTRRADGMIKIGTTVHFKARMKALTNEHGELQILLTHPGSCKEEDAMHKRFADLAIGHEWFRPDEALLSWIVSVRRQHANVRTRLPGTVPLSAVLSLLEDVAA